VYKSTTSELYVPIDEGEKKLIPGTRMNKGLSADRFQASILKNVASEIILPQQMAEIYKEGSSGNQASSENEIDCKLHNINENILELTGLNVHTKTEIIERKRKRLKSDIGNTKKRRKLVDPKITFKISNEDVNRRT